jgi:exopolysaccharide biosynthesis polyprenyl glycosylphosphotransferase
MDTLERADVAQRTAPSDGAAQRAARHPAADGAARRAALHPADVAQRAAPQRVTVAAPAAPPVGAARHGRVAHSRLLLAADAATVTTGLLAATLVHSAGATGRGQAVLALAALPIWMAALARSRSAAPRPSGEGRPILQAALISVAALSTLAIAAQVAVSRGWLATAAVVVPAAVVVGRLLVRRLAGRRELHRRVVVVGTDPEAIAFVHAAQRRPELGITPVGFVGPDDLGARGDCRWLGDLDQVDVALRAVHADGAVISLASVPPEVVNGLVRTLSDAGLTCALAPGLRDIDARRCATRDFDGRALVDVQHTERRGWRAGLKRIFDVTVAAVALLVSLPLSAAVALAIKLSSPGPVIFAQERVGRDGRPFRIYKFRTMVVDAEARKADLEAANEADGPMFKMARDPRVTTVGRMLRKLSIDEIPQFVNVLRGEMSVVGPRPALASEVTRWGDDVHGRLRVLPGITGMWQVSGRSDTTFDEYKRLDLYYVDNWTLGHDLRIVARTIPAVLAKRGAC